MSARRGFGGGFMLGWAVLGLGGCRSDSSAPDASHVVASSRPAPWFVDITDASKLDFQHDAGAEGRFLMPEIMGSGGAFLDYDNDGDLDVYLVNGGRLFGASGGDPKAPRSTHRLFRHEADGTFADVTRAAGVGGGGYGMGCAVGDIDNDGFVDLFVTHFGADTLYRNNGDGTFADVTTTCGITPASSGAWSCSAAFFDYDADGFLDLYVTHYVRYDEPRSCIGKDKRPDYCGPTIFSGVPDALYHNRGDGTFDDVSAASGIAGVAARGLGALCADFNGDGRCDVYVANDAEPNQLWINEGDGTFRDKALEMGLAVNGYGMPEGSMGVALGDADGDGDLDLFITNLTGEGNILYRCISPGRFEDHKTGSGLGAASMELTGFGTGFFDYDHDGDLDILIVNGAVNRAGVGHGVRRRTVHVRPPSASEVYAQPASLYENGGDGAFREVGESAGPICSIETIGRGLAFGDLDDDGDLDVLVTSCMGRARLFRNDAPKKGNWLMVRVLDARRHRDAIGATVIAGAGGRRFHRDINPAFSYLSSSEPRAHFGLGTAEHVDWLAVRLPDGTEHRLEGIAANQSVTIVIGEGDGARLESDRER